MQLTTTKIKELISYVELSDISEFVKCNYQSYLEWMLQEEKRQKDI